MNKGQVQGALNDIAGKMQENAGKTHGDAK